MKSKVSPRRVVIFIGAVVPTTILILGLNAPGSSATGKVHTQAVHQVITSHCRIAGSACNIGMKPRLLDNPLVHDLMTSAISIADRL